MTTIIVLFLICLALLLIGVSLVRNSKKKDDFIRSFELTVGIIAIATGLFLGSISTGSAIIKIFSPSDSKSKVKTVFANADAPRDTALQKRIKYLQQYVPAGALANADPRFASYAGTKESPRLPLAFPYEIRLDPNDASGILAYHTGEAPVDSMSSVKAMQKGIELANFNNRCLVAKLEKTTNDDQHQYLLLHFSSGVVDRFSTEEAMWKAAEDAGYTGGDALLPPGKLREDYFKDAAEAF